MSKKIIGFAGEMASGKTTCARYLMTKYGAQGCRFSTAMRDILNRLYIPESRYSNQAVSLALRQAFGDDVWAKVVAEDARKITAPLVVIDGIRRPADIEPFKDDESFTLVYVKADFDKRYERITKRGENADDIGKTREEFLQDQNLEAEQLIKQLEPLAQAVIVNDGQMAALEQKLDEMVRA